jgi:predicted choloylglycine hydrolase
MMQTFAKRISFERLPSPQRAPEAWRAHLARHWSTEGDWSEPPYLSTGEVRALLQAHMPELLPDFEALLPLYGDGPGAAQGLALYNLRPFWSGCSVQVARRPDRTTMLRNYDLGIDDCPCCFRLEELAGGGWILGSAEAGWGYLDGMNDRGLAIALTFGGRFVTGPGFIVLTVIRWLLTACATVDEALARLEERQIPHRLAQNLLMVDRSGDHAVVYLSPDRAMVVDREQVGCTNHQGQVEVEGNARFTRTLERLAYLTERDGALTLADFLRPPLYNQKYLEHFGTLYSVEYDPVALTAHYAWPERELVLGPQSEETAFTVTLTQG